MNVTNRIMNKIYVKPSYAVYNMRTLQIICASATTKMEFSDTEKATHNVDPDEDVLVKQQSNWDTEW